MYGTHSDGPAEVHLTAIPDRHPYFFESWLENKKALRIAALVTSLIVAVMLLFHFLGSSSPTSASDSGVMKKSSKKSSSGTGYRAKVDVSADKRVDFLIKNTMPSGLPLSYLVEPVDYFDKVPDDLRPWDVLEDKAAPECGGMIVPKKTWDKYEFQTERMLTTYGCNIYDGAVGSMALAVLGLYDEAMSFFWEVLHPGHTEGVVSIRGNNECKGREVHGECTDKGDGSCGLCYGDRKQTMTLPRKNSFLFRMIGDYWAWEGTVNELCPNLKRPWTWNDWKPVLGDNAWANLIGALHVLWLRNGEDPSQISDNAAELRLALDFIPGVKAMVIGDTGGIYFCPRNTYYGYTRKDIGSRASTENNASLLAGLKSLRYLLEKLNRPRYDAVLKDVQELIEGIRKYLKAAWDPEKKYFRSGAIYDAEKDKLDWSNEPGVPEFAVDCQTWVASVLGSDQIDSWFGDKTTLNMWETTKKLAGYGVQPDGKVKGVGYTENSKDQSWSGEWTYGAANWVKIMATESKYSSSIRAKLLAEANFMADSVKAELTQTVTRNGTTLTGVKYANKRYYIPFGWWANPIPSRASTAWAIMWDQNFNPLHLSGKFYSQYDGRLD